MLQVSEKTQGFLHGLFKSGAFHVLKRISKNIVWQVCLFLVLTFRSCFGFNDFQILYIHKKLRRPLLFQLFTEALHRSTLVEANQTELGFVITNDKPSYVAKEDSIC